MSGKKDIDAAIEAHGPSNVTPIGKTEFTAGGPQMSLVIGGLDATAKSMADWQTAHFNELVANGMDPAHAAVITSFTPKPKAPED